jgi:hypothetical protein
MEGTFCDFSLEPILGQKSGSRLKIRHAQILFRKSCSPIIQRPCWMWWGYSPHVWNPHLQDMCVGSSRYPSIESIGSCMTEWSTVSPDMDGQLRIKMFKMSDECLEKPVLCMENPQNSIWPKPPVAALQTAMALVPSHTEITSGQISWHQGPKGRSAVRAFWVRNAWEKILYF